MFHGHIEYSWQMGRVFENSCSFYARSWVKLIEIPVMSKKKQHEKRK